MKQKSFLTILCSLLLNMMTFAQTKTVDLNGTWLLSTEKSTLGNLPATVAVQQMTITQTGDKLIIISVNGQNKNTYVNTMDNQPVSIVTGAGAKIISSVQPDGENRFKRNLKASVPNDYEKTQYNRVETWSLSADGKILILAETVTPGGEGNPYSFTAVYTKQ